MTRPWNLDFWKSGEYQVIDERLKDMEKAHGNNYGSPFCPASSNRYRSLALTHPDNVRVAIIGQDPYPDPAFATGLAFSIPPEVPKELYPPTLRCLLTEYSSDLGLPFPNSGDLSRWASQGVLLWNQIPTCKAGVSLSHDWTEYVYLTREIVQRLSKRGIVFALLGAVARRSLPDIDLTKNEVCITSHPSPRGSYNSKTPFLGSRLFSTINDKLISNGLDPVDWRLDVPAKASTSEEGVQRPGMVRGNVLPNITGAELPGIRSALPAPNLKSSTFELEE